MDMSEQPERTYLVEFGVDRKVRVKADDVKYITDELGMMTVTLKLKGETVGHYTDVRNWVREDLAS